MKTLFTPEQLEIANSTDLLLLECEVCRKPFQQEKRFIKFYLKNNNKNKFRFCSPVCRQEARKKLIEVNCVQCNKLILRQASQFKRPHKHFCGYSCLHKWNSQHKHGQNPQRSKLEKWIQNQLNILYPNLEIRYNDRAAVNAELDIFIPSLNLAFELNGIFHYEPIFGEDKLKKIQTNDNRRFQACLEKGIELCIIDTSKHKYNKEHLNAPYLKIIIDLINLKLTKPNP